MRRAAIYARYSTDLQRDRSIEDQIEICRAYAERQGLAVIDVYADRAKSGASMHGRDGIQRLIADGRQRLFDVVLTETLSRLGRDEGDRADIRKHMTFSGVKIMTPEDGEVNRLTDGIKALVDAQYLEDLKVMVRRGMAGVVRDGRSAGGKAYGYEPVSGEPGQLRIVEDEAAIVRRIFGLYRGGASPRSIAAGLNADGIPPPRGAKWNASTINGNISRGNGILHNPLYAGRQVWNRVRMVKDPATGKRVSRINPESEWLTVKVPALQIIDAETFERVQARKAAVGGSHAQKAPRSRRLLSGVLRCACCGGGMTIVGADRSGQRVQCSTHRESGSCGNGARYYLDKIEGLVLEALRLQLADERLVGEYVEAYRVQHRADMQAARSALNINRRKLQEAEDIIRRTVTALSKGLVTDEEAAEILAPARADKHRLAAAVSAAEPQSNVIEIEPRAVRQFRENIEALSDIAHQRDEPSPTLIEHFREVIKQVTVSPRQAGEEYEVTIEGYLSGLIGTADSALVMVAEVRYRGLPQPFDFRSPTKTEHGGGHSHASDNLSFAPVAI